MDHIDVGIIRCLTKDARMNASHISQQVNLSLSAVLERIKKLEASGLIRGYGVLINEQTAKETPARIAISHGTIARDDGPVMVGGKVAYHIYYTIRAVAVRSHHIGHKVHTATLRRRLLCGHGIHSLLRARHNTTNGNLLRKEDADKRHNGYNG